MKKPKMDNLAKEAMLARQAHMTYGKWKAMQDPVKVVKKIPEGWMECKGCGKLFKPYNKIQKYCDVTCCRRESSRIYREKYRDKIRERSRLYEQKRKEKKKAGA